jgi:undecaprenyl pyrophosphate phosphatase UppP
MIGVCLAVVVHITYSIKHDCYFSMNEDPKRVKFFIAVLAVINGVIAVFQGLNGELIENGMLTNNCANLIVALVLAAVLVALITKKYDDEEEED